MNTAGIENGQAKPVLRQRRITLPCKQRKAGMSCTMYAAIIPYLLFNDAVTARTSQ